MMVEQESVNRIDRFIVPVNKNGIVNGYGKNFTVCPSGHLEIPKFQPSVEISKLQEYKERLSTLVSCLVKTDRSVTTFRVYPNIYGNSYQVRAYLPQKTAEWGYVINIENSHYKLNEGYEVEYHSQEDIKTTFDASIISQDNHVYGNKQWPYFNPFNNGNIPEAISTVLKTGKLGLNSFGIEIKLPDEATISIPNLGRTIEILKQHTENTNGSKNTTFNARDMLDVLAHLHITGPQETREMYLDMIENNLLTHFVAPEPFPATTPNHP